jgi:hypothetical protein
MACCIQIWLGIPRYRILDVETPEPWVLNLHKATVERSKEKYAKQYLLTIE